MTREEFLNKFYDLTRQLEALVDELPTIPELERVIHLQDKSKIAVFADIMTLEVTVETLSKQYFDQD